MVGVLAIGAAFLPRRSGSTARFQRWIVVLIALMALFLGIYGLLLPAGSGAHPNAFGVANLESPADDLLHLVIGITAAAALVAKPASERPTG